MSTLVTRISDLATRIATEFKSIRTLIAAERASLKAEILGSAGAAYDTLEELKAYADSGQAADQMALAARVRFDAAQTLTAGQKAQAKSNIDAYGAAEIGNPDTDFVAVFAAGLV